MLLNEIEILRCLRHPKIISLYEIYESTNYIHFVIEYLGGGELFDKITEKGTYSEVDAAKVMRQLLEIISYCHSKHVIHRDLKPENMILVGKASDLDFKLIDFGLSSLIKPGTKEYECCGSPGFAAPEVILGEGYTSKADIFSCGIILCFLLIGNSPFDDPTLEGVIRNNKKGTFSMHGEEWLCISDEAKDLVQKMTQRDPSRRPTAEDALRHPLFKLSFRSKEDLSSVLGKMKKHVTESDDITRSLLTSVPRLGRDLDLSENPCFTVKPDATNIPAATAATDTADLKTALKLELSKASDVDGFNSCDFSDEHIDETVGDPKCDAKPVTSKATAHFIAGEADTRALPHTPGSEGASRRAFDRAGNYTTTHGEAATGSHSKELNAASKDNIQFSTFAKAALDNFTDGCAGQTNRILISQVSLPKSKPYLLKGGSEEGTGSNESSGQKHSPLLSTGTIIRKSGSLAKAIAKMVTEKKRKEIEASTS